MKERFFVDPRGTGTIAARTKRDEIASLTDGLTPLDVMRAPVERGELRDADAFLAAEVGGLSDLPGAPLVTLAALLSHHAGSVFLSREALLPTLRESGLAVDEELAGLVVATFDQLRDLPDERLCGTPGTYTPLITDRGRLYLQKAHRQENALAHAAANWLARPSLFEPRAVDEALADVLRTPPLVRGKPIALSEEQSNAVARALGAGFTVITGGPGTGKTSIVVAILRALVRLGVEPSEIALAAPTGKAADRMRAAVSRALKALRSPNERDHVLREANLQAKTVHRLLGYSPRARRFTRGERDPIGERVVILDEASMVDLEQMEAIARAISSDTLLIVLGDADQLPSVSAGAVLRELAMTPATVRLTHSFRMNAEDDAGGHVLRIANQINAGGAIFGERGARVRVRAEDLALEGVEAFLPETPRRRYEFLAEWHARHALDRDVVTRALSLDDDAKILEELFAASARARLLCVTRGRATGTRAINDWFHREINPHERGPHAGEPIIVVRNDYRRALFNGDNGLVLWIRGNGHRPRLSAVFRTDDGYVAHPLAAAHGLITLAHAITVHKSQGSEHDRVAVILPDEPIPVLSRALLYTAMTRARSSAVIVGTHVAIEHAIQNEDRRRGALLERIRAAAPLSFGSTDER